MILPFVFWFEADKHKFFIYLVAWQNEMKWFSYWQVKMTWTELSNLLDPVEAHTHHKQELNVW